MYNKVISLFEQRGVFMEDIIECVYYLQKRYIPDLTKDQIQHYIDSVLNKREVQHAIVTGIMMDIMVEESRLGDEEIQKLIMEDYGLYGVDEVLAYGICNLYGSIALTNFGYIDKVKPGIIGKLNEHNGQCHTFLDDIVGAVAAAAASKLAHDSER